MASSESENESSDRANMNILKIPTETYLLLIMLKFYPRLITFKLRKDAMKSTHIQSVNQLIWNI